MAFNNVTGACRTVVVEEIIAVCPVFGTIVREKCIQDSHLLCTGQVQDVLSHLTAPFPVIVTEWSCGGASQFIVGQAEYESQHEVWRTEIENAIVVNEVFSCPEIVASQCCMAIETVYFFMRRTGDEPDLYVVGFTQTVFLRINCLTGNNKE
jgi:hypothetical protein